MIIKCLNALKGALKNKCSLLLLLLILVNIIMMIIFVKVLNQRWANFGGPQWVLKYEAGFLIMCIQNESKKSCNKISVFEFPCYLALY